MMAEIFLISRHRQWRAWQFARRRSGLFRNSNSSSLSNSNDPQHENVVIIIVVVYFTLLLIFWVIWPTAASYMLAGAFLLSLLGWILKIFL